MLNQRVDVTYAIRAKCSPRANGIFAPFLISRKTLLYKCEGKTSQRKILLSISGF